MVLVFVLGVNQCARSRGYGHTRVTQRERTARRDFNIVFNIRWGPESQSNSYQLRCFIRGFSSIRLAGSGRGLASRTHVETRFLIIFPYIDTRQQIWRVEAERETRSIIMFSFPFLSFFLFLQEKITTNSISRDGMMDSPMRDYVAHWSSLLSFFLFPEIEY